ncbi:CHAD domain-containing protein [Methylomagnum sp.]
MSAYHCVEFIVPSPLGELVGVLEQSLGFRPARHHEISLTYYDSFDGRLHRHGLELAIELSPAGPVADCLCAMGERHESIPVAEPPRFAVDLPAAPWRDRVADALDMRALLPQAELRGERREFVLDDAADETLLRLTVDVLSVANDNVPQPLPARLRLTARGHRKEFRHWVERLSGEFGGVPAEDSLFAAARSLLGLIPGDPSALPRTPMDPTQRADAALKQVLRHLLRTLQINEADTKAETDTEFLHDFRVAVRRTRSALGQLKQVFPDRTTQRYAKGFAALGRITSEPRDMDVYLLDFDHYAADLPEPLRGPLEPLREMLRQRAESSHARLNRYLGSAAYRRLIRSWEIFLDTPPPRRPKSARALLPIHGLASRRIWKLYRRVLREGADITPASPPESIHELRKTAKKLRYLMEFFRSLYPPDKIGPLVKILKGLQDHLGEYQDVHVQIIHLRQFSAELRQADTPTETLLALGALLERQYVRDRLLRDGFEAAFAEFAGAGHRRKFRQLFRM